MFSAIAVTKYINPPILVNAKPIATGIKSKVYNIIRRRVLVSPWVTVSIGTPASVYSSFINKAKDQKCGGVHKNININIIRLSVDTCPVATAQPIIGGKAPAAPQTLPSAATSAFIKPCKAKQQEIPTEVERNALNTLDNFTCHICLDKFSTVGDKKPSNLPCGHTFCQQCLLNGKLSKCPSCRSKIPFFSDINKPPTNFPIISIIENLSTKRELIPELQYSFAQRILIHELAKAQDYVTELKIELKFSEIENQDKAEGT
jgi:hypothetical protein